MVTFSSEANVYVADNASTDGSVAFLKNNFPQVNLIQNKVNGGFAKGYNDALENLQEDIFILLNSDVEVTENWLQPIVHLFESEDKIAAVQPKILDYNHKSHFEYSGAAGGFIDKFGYPYCRGRIFQTLEEDHGQYNDDFDIFWASGACMAVSKNSFYEAGGFDEAFFAHQEEIDFCWRLHTLGYKVKYTAASRVFHMGGATLNDMNPRKTFYNFRNNLFLLVKNVPAPQIYMVLFTRMILDGIAGLKFIAEGKFSHFTVVLQAHFSFYRHLGLMLQKRRNIRKSKKYFTVTSVVLAYFIGQKKKFSDLKSSD